MPDQAVPWSKGKALIATGIPVPPVDYKGADLHHRAGQQRVLLYPGLGLGTIVLGATTSLTGCCWPLRRRSPVR